LAAIAAIVIEVGLLLDQHAAIVAREQAYRKVVGQRAGRDPHGRLLTKRCRDGLFKFGDDSAARILIGLDGGRKSLEKCGVLYWRLLKAVAASSHRKRLNSLGTKTGSGSSKNRGGKERSAIHMARENTTRLICNLFLACRERKSALESPPQ
jgi:hypothetical protein